MQRLLDGEGGSIDWELLARREMGLKAVACKKKVFAGVSLTPTTGKTSLIEGFSYQAYQFVFGKWPEADVGSSKRKRKQEPGSTGANDGSGAKLSCAAKSRDLQAWKARPKDCDTGDEWKRKQRSAADRQIKRTVRPLPTLVKGPCGMSPVSGERRRLTLWDNGYDLESWLNLGDYSRTGKLGFMAGVIFKCGTFIVITDVTA